MYVRRTTIIGMHRSNMHVHTYILPVLMHMHIDINIGARGIRSDISAALLSFKVSLQFPAT